MGSVAAEWIVAGTSSLSLLLLAAFVVREHAHHAHQRPDMDWWARCTTITVVERDGRVWGRSIAALHRDGPDSLTFTDPVMVQVWNITDKGDDRG